MMIIFKYPLNLGITELRIPYAAILLDVQMQGDTPMLWAQVDPQGIPRTLRIHCVGTGQEVPKHSIHLSTVQHEALVWHFFAEGWL